MHGFLAASSAAVADTCGAANDVPSNSLYVATPPANVVERMSTPGAAMSTHDPRLENAATRPLWVVPATASTRSYAAGYSGNDQPELPAAATISTPFACANLTASPSASLAGPPNERLMTRAWCVTA